MNDETAIKTELEVGDCFTRTRSARGDKETWCVIGTERRGDHYVLVTLENVDGATIERDGDVIGITEFGWTSATKEETETVITAIMQRNAQAIERIKVSQATLSNALSVRRSKLAPDLIKLIDGSLCWRRLNAFSYSVDKLQAVKDVKRIYGYDLIQCVSLVDARIKEWAVAHPAPNNRS